MTATYFIINNISKNISNLFNRCTCENQSRSNLFLNNQISVNKNSLRKYKNNVLFIMKKKTLSLYNNIDLDYFHF